MRSADARQDYREAQVVVADPHIHRDRRVPRIVNAIHDARGHDKMRHSERLTLPIEPRRRPPPSSDDLSLAHVDTGAATAGALELDRLAVDEHRSCRSGVWGVGPAGGGCSLRGGAGAAMVV